MRMAKQSCKDCKWNDTCGFSVVIKGENKCLDFRETTNRLAIENMIANGVTIPVRCKECRKRYNPKECPMCIRVYGEQHDVTHDDGYCDRGERRSDAETD